MDRTRQLVSIERPIIGNQCGWYEGQAILLQWYFQEDAVNMENGREEEGGEREREEGSRWTLRGRFAKSSVAVSN